MNKVDTTWRINPTLDQSLSVSTTSATAANKFSAQTYAIRVCASVALHYAVTDAGSAATATNAYLPANWVEEMAVNPGQKISAIASASGTLNISELTH